MSFFDLFFFAWSCRRLAVALFALGVACLWAVASWVRSPSYVAIEPALLDSDGNPNERTKRLRSIVTEHGFDDATGNKTVVVVGAGAAGLMAGYTLKYLGVRNVVLLEASDQWGGRTQESTDISGRVPLDLGAEWLHYHPDLLRDFLLFGDDENNKANLPETIEYCPRTYKIGYINWFRFFYLDFKFLHTTWHGYLRGFVYPYVADGLQTGAVVDTIDYSDNNENDETNKKIRLVYHRRNENGENGTAATTEHMVTADRVIVATPVSVLQQNNNNRQSVRFVPSLSRRKMTAINGVRFAPGLKVWLVFDEPFYDGMIFPNGLWQARLEDKTYFDALWGKGSLTENEHILALFEVGDRALDHVGLTDDEIVADLLRELDEIYGGKATEHYTGKFYVQNWSKQPFIRGAYSYNWKTGSDWDEFYDDVPKLAEPVKDTIYFAGEYTDADYMATVSGAMLSGRRAAVHLVRDLSFLSSSKKNR